MFFFYVLNFIMLIVLITAEHLQLRFGIFKWTVPIDNIKKIQLDEIPAFKKYGGAGIHFMTVYKRYRVSFNFLEYPRICVSLKKKRGLVQDVSFSTRTPEKVMQVLSGIVDNEKMTDR